jgi:hypothetical protein
MPNPSKRRRVLFLVVGTCILILGVLVLAFGGIGAYVTLIGQPFTLDLSFFGFTIFPPSPVPLSATGTVTTSVVVLQSQGTGGLPCPNFTHGDFYLARFLIFFWHC